MRRIPFLLIALGFLWPTLAASAQEPVKFIGVALDPETRRADEKLRNFLQNQTSLNILAEQEQAELEYAAMIDTLVAWSADSVPFVARATPYVLVVAEMLGARLDVLASYESQATGTTTYRSYFVVRKDHFTSRPDLNGLLDYLRQQDRRTFIYHSKFSTSSYFLPSLFFRSNRIFQVDSGAEGSITAIRSRKLGDSSSGLVQAIADADGEYELAAVWDGTKNKFEQPGHAAAGQRVYFVPLPTRLPNDLLVTSSALGEKKKAIKYAISHMDEDEIAIGDFLTWRDITGSSAARALAELRWLARERPAPVTVEISAEGVPGDWTDAVRQAVRLSGTEFMLFDPDFHGRAAGDFKWDLKAIHDGAVELTSSIPGLEPQGQRFQISFATTEDLTRRVGALIHSRLHRIRYLWPYEDETPTVVRDVDFGMPTGHVLKVQKIAWKDPQHNHYDPLDTFTVRVVSSDFHKFQLSADPFAAISLGQAGSAAARSRLAVDPLSNVSYRVLLARPAQEPFLFRALTVLFVALLLLAAAGAVFVDLKLAGSPVKSWITAWRRRTGGS